ncbi:membrane hypothetical protein [Nocardioides sp. AX2bis]|nr:membrane hypothetical protein [Nocardioides sp. AX2bis]
MPRAYADAMPPNPAPPGRAPEQVRARGGAGVPWGLDLAAAWSWRVLLLAALGWVLVQLVATYSVLVLPLAIAVLLAALADPAVRLLTRWLPRGLAALLVVVVGLVVVGGLLGFVGQQIATGASDLATSAAEGIEQVRTWLVEGPLDASQSQVDDAVAALRDAVASFAGDGALQQALAVGSGAGNAVVGFFLALFALFFFLSDGPRIWGWAVRLAPRAARGHVDSSGRVAWTTLTHYVRATVAVALVDAIGITVWAAVLGVPFLAAIFVLTFLGAFIPVVGATLAGAVATQPPTPSRRPDDRARDPTAAGARPGRDPGRPRGPARGGGGDPDGAVALAVGALRRSGAPQVREPAAHRLLQGPRRLLPDGAADRGGAGEWCRRGLGRQPRAGRRPGRAAARHPRHRVHAGGRADPEGAGDPGVRRRRGLRGALHRGRPGGRAALRGGDRGGADPPLRPRRHHGRPGHLRPGGGRAGAGGAHRAGADRRWGADRGRRDRAQGAAARRAPGGRPGRGRGGVPDLARAGCPGRAHLDAHHGRRHRGRDAGGADLRRGARPRRRGRHGLRGLDVTRARGAGRADQDHRGTGRRRRGGRAARPPRPLADPAGRGAVRGQHRPAAAGQGHPARHGRRRALPRDAGQHPRRARGPGGAAAGGLRRRRQRDRGRARTHLAHVARGRGGGAAAARDAGPGPLRTAADPAARARLPGHRLSRPSARGAGQPLKGTASTISIFSVLPFGASKSTVSPLAAPSSAAPSGDCGEKTSTSASSSSMSREPSRNCSVSSSPW